MPVTSPFDEATDSRSAHIDLAAVRANVRVHVSAGGAGVLVGVEHDAYGHGLDPVATAAVEAGATWLGVSDLAEANAVRAAGVSVPLLVTGAAPVRGRAPADVHVAVASASAAAAAEDAGAAGIHLLIDCGDAARAMTVDDAVDAVGRDLPVTGLMGVHGATVSGTEAAAALARAKRAIRMTATAITHLADADDDAQRLEGQLPHIGGGAYGLPDRAGRRRGTPALRAAGRVVTVKRIRAGEGVSYGYTYHAPRDGRIALVTGGYAQGVVRSLGNRASVAVHGRRHPIIGRVAMDVCVIDLSDANVVPGDEVVFLGDPDRGEPAVAEWVDATGMTAAELVIRLAGGFHRSHLS